MLIADWVRSSGLEQNSFNISWFVSSMCVMVILLNGFKSLSEIGANLNWRKKDSERNAWLGLLKIFRDKWFKRVVLETESSLQFNWRWVVDPVLMFCLTLIFKMRSLNGCLRFLFLEETLLGSSTSLSSRLSVELIMASNSSLQ